MSQKSALILGTLAGQVDAVDLLHDKGWVVHTCGHRREGPGVTAADGFHLVDILDVDAVAELAADLEVDVVYSVGSDIAMPTVARVSQQLGLPGFHSVELTDTLQRKDLLRRRLAAADLSPVAHRSLSSIDDLEGFATFPAIVKPSDSQGQRGITVVESPAAAGEAVIAALGQSSSGTAIIEEWLDGPEISVHAFVVDGAVRFFLPSDRLVWEGDLIGVAAGHVLPAHTLDPATEPEVRNIVESFVSAFAVVTGPLYFQMKLTPRGPRIIEVASRFDGCHLWRLILQHTGFNLMEAAFDLLTGEPWRDPEPFDDTTTDSLFFHLGPPGRAFHAADYPTSGNVTFSEIQVDEGALPRDANGVVCRMGYYMKTELQ
ncbi:MAG: ATP-grasp domain-containing protein [Acidimicrobiia bacterium]|nr:ATP-grasp domain-containing protein [Acidimicrobiia bacterium]